MNRGQAGHHEPARNVFTAAVGKNNVKICALCGTLNLKTNVECWTCRWHGEFDYDAEVIEMAWQRLVTLYEDVRVEHVTSRKILALGDFGRHKPPTGWRSIARLCHDWWTNFQTQRDLRMAQRQAALRSRLPSRSNQLGV